MDVAVLAQVKPLLEGPPAIQAREIRDHSGTERRIPCGDRERGFVDFYFQKCQLMLFVLDNLFTQQGFLVQHGWLSQNFRFLLLLGVLPYGCSWLLQLRWLSTLRNQVLLLFASLGS